MIPLLKSAPSADAAVTLDFTWDEVVKALIPDIVRGAPWARRQHVVYRISPAPRNGGVRVEIMDNGDGIGPVR